MRWMRSGIFEEIINIARTHYTTHHEQSIWYAIDSSLKKAPFIQDGGKNPTDRAKNGIKQVIVVDRKGTALAALVAPANVHDSKLLTAFIEQIADNNGKVLILAADSAFDVKKLRKLCAMRNIALITPTNPRRAKNTHSVKVAHRWVIERTFGWISWCRGLKTCWAKSRQSHLAFLNFYLAVRLFTSS